MKLAAIKKWNYWHALVLLLGGIGAVSFSRLGILLMAGSLSFFVLVFSYVKQHKAIGYANAVTVLRLVLLVVLGYCFFTISNALAFAVALLIITLDGIDGFVARRFNETSDFGAYLDMETDTFFVAIFCTVYYLNGTLEWWIVPVGFMRSLYVGGILVFRLQDQREESTRFAKTIAVLLFVALLTPLVLPKVLYHPIAVVASILVAYSFLFSFWELILSTERGGE